MGTAFGSSAPRWSGLLAAIAACFAVFAASGTAIAAGPAEPPSFQQLERQTERLEQRWDPAPAQSYGDHGGGVDPGPGDGGGADAGQGDGGGTGTDPELPPGTEPASAIFPANRIVSYYGAPQLAATVVGKLSPGKAVRKLVRQARPYERGDREVVPQINLIATIASATAGDDGLYRFNQSDAVIGKYLRQVRKVDGRLMLDIQPGRARLRDELRKLRPWLLQPDVDLGIDAEWNVGRRGVPGQTEGRFTKGEVNFVSGWLADLVADNDLPPKALIVHQFREGSIKRRSKIDQPQGVSVTLNFDGIGGAAAKKAGYKNLAQRGLFNGFSLFYDRDVDILKPRGVLRLRPPADYVMYQ